MSPSGLESCEEFRCWLGWDPLTRAFRRLLLPEWEGALEEPPACPWTSHHLIAVTCPNDTSFSIPSGGAKMIFSVSYNKQAPHRYVCFCSWQNNTGISPYYWLLLMACHGSLSFGAHFPTWPACAGVGCRNPCSKPGGLGFCSLVGFSSGARVCCNC